MIDRKQLEKKLARSLEAVRCKVTDTVDFLENRAPGQVESLGKTLHERAESLNLYKPRRRSGVGFSMLLLLGAAAVGGYLVKSGKLSI